MVVKKFLNCARLVLIVVLAYNSAAKAEDQKFIWKDFEIVGQKTITREAIINEIPIQLGTLYQLDIAGWQQICSKIKEKFRLHFAYCSAVRFVDGRAYFEVDVVEPGDESHIKYRSIPSKHIPLASPAVVRIYDSLMARLWFLFSQGKVSGEKTNGDFLDFDDPIMHQMALELVKSVPKYRKNLIRVIKDDAESANRAKAAWLLCWALDPKKSIGDIYKYMDDPTVLGRNDIVRFMGHWIGQIENENLRHKIIDKLILQLNHPSHADRTKALWNLFELVKKYDGDRVYLRRYLKDIQYVGSASILENVGGVAKQILQLMDLS